MGLYVANASALQPAVESLGVSESTLERMFETCGLPPSISSRPAGIVPLYAAERFLDLAHRTAGDDTFCFRSFDQEEARPEGLVANAPLPAMAVGLDATRLLARSLDGIITGARFYCQVQGKHVWILRTSSATEYSDKWSVLQYTLRAILSGMKRLHGARVSPARLRMPPGFSEVDLPVELQHLPILEAGGEFGLGYSVSDIAMASCQRRFASARETRHLRLDGSTTEDISTCLLNLIGTTDSRKLAERMARAFGVSLRTYQRRLASVGTTHAAVLENARITQALERLSGTDDSIADISFELGYPFPGHFTRFFRRKMGMSPTEFRRLH